MAPVAMSFGFLLTILGIVLFSLAGTKSLTALIPSYLGIALAILGLLARSEKLRMHAMHVAALLGLVGLLGGVVMGIVGLVHERPATVWGGSLAMAALCPAFLVLCVRSFIAARRARKQSERA
jgi:hypothetical protein